MSAVFEIENKDNDLKKLANQQTAVKASANNYLISYAIPARHKKQYKCLSFLMMLCIALIIIHFIFMDKIIPMYCGVMSIGSVFVPLWAILDDIIAEVYGFKMFMRFFWYSWMVLNVLVLLYTFAFLSDPYSTHQGQYQFVFRESSSVLFYIYMTIAAYVTTRLNGFLLIKWKILLKGKWFWLRFIGSTILADFIYLIMVIPVWIHLGTVPTAEEGIVMTVYSVLFRFIAYVILAYPSTIVVNLLKVIENVNNNESVSLNPFSSTNSERHT